MNVEVLCVYKADGISVPMLECDYAIKELSEVYGRAVVLVLDGDHPVVRWLGDTDDTESEETQAGAKDRP